MAAIEYTHGASPIASNPRHFKIDKIGATMQPLEQLSPFEFDTSSTANPLLKPHYPFGIPKCEGNKPATMCWHHMNISQPRQKLSHL